MIFKERELNQIGRGLLPYDAVLLHGFEPVLKAAELEVVARDDGEECDGEAILLAEGVDVASGVEALLDSGEERLLIGRGEVRIAGECAEQVRGVGGGVDPALDGIEAAGVALVAQVGEGGGEQVAVLRRREEGLAEIALGEGGEGERGEGALEDRVGAGVADADGEVLLERRQEGEEFLIGELRVADPDVEDGVGEGVAELGIGRREPGA